MGRFLIIFLFGFVQFANLSGQAEYGYPIKAAGLSLSTVHFKLYDFNNKNLADEYQEFYSNSTLDAILWYNKTLNRFSSIQVEFKHCGRYSIIKPDTLSLGVTEGFIEIPLIYKFTLMSNRIGYNPVHVYAGFGVSYSLLTRQNLYVPYNRVLPSTYRKETGFGKYGKLAVVTDFGVSIDLSSNFAGILMGYRSNLDALSFFKSNKIQVTPNYWAYGFYLGMYLRFGNPDPD